MEPATGPLRADIRVPSSKSATHRALVAAALAEGVSEIRSPLDADDTRRTLEGLRALGVDAGERQGSWRVVGTGGRLPGGGTVQLGASGTSARFLTAVAALGARASLLDGSSRLRERPMHELVAALTALGATIRAHGSRGLPIRAGGAPVAGGEIAVSGATSSQFLSALLLTAPAFRTGLRLEVNGPRVSFPYVIMTIEMLERFGARIDFAGGTRFRVPPQTLAARTIEVEGDHSSASYLLAATMILGGRLRLRGLRRDSAQPDARFLKDLAGLGGSVSTDTGGAVVFEAGGRVDPFAWNLMEAPDLAPTAAVLAMFASGPSTLSGLDHLRFKESDRLEALRSNLSRMGAVAEVEGGTIRIVPPGRAKLRGATIDVAADHRIAMAFAVAGLAVPGVRIGEPESVAKSYPEFWADLARLTRTGSSARD